MPTGTHRLGNTGKVIVNGVLAPIVGAVSMDLITVDITDCPSLVTGDAVTLLGRQNGVSMDAQDIARLAETIPYAILCVLAQVSRAGLYRWLQRRQPGAEETVVRAAIQEVAVEHHRRYGYRRITAELRHRGMMVNRKRVLRMMQEDNLLAIRSRKFVRTTDSRHPFEVS